jgi:hypothetical protein
MHAPDRPLFRPTLETLEDRLSPGSLGNVFGLLHRPAGDDALFQAASAYSAQAAGANPDILPPQSHPFGATYAQWSARWTQWALSLPVENNPLFDTADASTGQSGHVWFLGGSFTATDVTRTAVIPSGTALFFPVVNDIEVLNWFPAGTTVQDIREFAKSVMDQATNLSASIDGVPVSNLSTYRVQSPEFNVTLPSTGTSIPQAFDIPIHPDVPATGVTDGIYLMVHPLSPGPHSITFGYHSPGVPEQNQPPFDVSITYNITVTPGH